MREVVEKKVRTEIGPASELLRNMGDMMVNMQSDAIKLFEFVKDSDGYFSRSILMDAFQYSGNFYVWSKTEILGQKTQLW